MSREQPTVPLLLWISTAILAHIATGGGAEQVARLYEERAELREFAASIRSRFRNSAPMEVALIDDSPLPAEPREEPPLPSKPDDQKKPEDPAAKKVEPSPEAQPKPKAEPPKKEPEKKKPDPIVKIAPTPAPTPPPPPPPPPADRRIAVRQHAQPNQDDNPNSHFIADEANHVEEESVARITAHDQDDPNPTPGGQHAGPTPDPGNSDHTKVAESENHPGEATHAPGEHANDPSPLPSEHPKASLATNTPEPPKDRNPPAGERNSPPAPVAPQPPAAAPASGASGPASPDAIANSGEYRLDPARPGASGTSGSAGAAGSQGGPSASSNPLRMLGLNGTSTPSGINLNLTQRQVVAVVGEDQLTRERIADGERRKSAHRGSWQASGFERWRPAIENYVSSVKPGNQTALNTARVPFATYLTAIHNRIHPIFAEDFLDSLAGLPSNHPLNDMHLYASLEIILSRDDGHVVRMGVTRTSGVTAFDIAALDSVQRASPFGKPPAAIVSPDGNVYFHWEFHRDPVYACSTMNARPYLLKGAPPTDTPSTPPSGPSILPSDPRERAPGPSQQGRLGPLPRAVPPRTGRKAIPS